MDISISHPSVGRTPQPNFTDVQVKLSTVVHGIVL